MGQQIKKDPLARGQFMVRASDDPEWVRQEVRRLGLRGEKTGAPNPMLCWRINGQRAIRMGDWKLLVQRRKVQLYNLANDIDERKNLASKEPEKVKELLG